MPAARLQAVHAAERVAELLEADPDDPGKRRIKPELWPKAEFVNVGVRGDASELDGLERLAAGAETRPLKFIDAVNA